MKIKVLAIVLIGIVVFFMYRGDGDESQVKKVDVAEKTTSTPQPTPPPQPPIDKIQPVSGWIFDHKEVRPDSSFTYWYVPSDYSKETEFFKISNLNVGYRLKVDAIIEFQSQSNPESFTAIRHEAETGLKFKKDEEGNFSIPYPESELQQLASNSEAFRFRPIGDNPMIGLKVSKVE
jgi:hypothetical protein